LRSIQSCDRRTDRYQESLIYNIQWSDQIAASSKDAHTDTNDDAASEGKDQSGNSENDEEQQKRRRTPERPHTFDEINRLCTEDHTKEEIF
jgi:hypothetical protein